MTAKFQEVHGGRFHCDSCGYSWVGTWHGPKNEITCLFCNKLLFESNGDDNSNKEKTPTS